MSKIDTDSQVDIDKLIHRLLQSKGADVKIQPYEVRQVCIKIRDIFLQQPMLLTLKAPIKICGDVHGQYRDLLRIFNSGGLPSKQQYLFLGDYVDRGKNSLQCIMLLFCFKIKYPTSFFMLRGNHQCSYINRLYGFYDQCKRRCNLKVFKMFIDVFNVLPIAAVVNKRIICMHGGLSPQITKMQEIQKIQRPTQIPQNGPLCDLLWSDPDKDVKGWQDNLQRGVSFVFGVDIIENFLKQNDLDVVCRAHQVVQEGFEFVGNRKLVTLFSAPNYCGMFDNDGAYMNVDEKLVCSFSIIKNKQHNKQNELHHQEKKLVHSNKNNETSKLFEQNKNNETNKNNQQSKQSKIRQSKKQMLKKLTNQVRQKLFK